MPILSVKGFKDTMNTLTPYERGVDDPTFFETMSASYGFVRDEERSTSAFYNNQAYFDRRNEVKRLVSDGMDLRDYVDDQGNFDYDSFAEQTGLVKTDREIFEERNQMLTERRARSQQVMDRGSGFAQFLGMAGSYMADPINIATVPFGGVGVGAKSLSILGKTLVGARNMSAVAVATELAIQPQVMDYKHSIDSPYGVDDAIRVIGTSAIAGGVLGGFFGGLSGYLGKVAEKAQMELIKQNPYFLYDLHYTRAPYVYNPAQTKAKPEVLPDNQAQIDFLKGRIDVERTTLKGEAIKYILNATDSPAYLDATKNIKNKVAYEKKLENDPKALGNFIYKAHEKYRKLVAQRVKETEKAKPNQAKLDELRTKIEDQWKMIEFFEDFKRVKIELSDLDNIITGGGKKAVTTPIIQSTKRADSFKTDGSYNVTLSDGVVYQIYRDTDQFSSPTWFIDSASLDRLGVPNNSPLRTGGAGSNKKEVLDALSSLIKENAKKTAKVEPEKINMTFMNERLSAQRNEFLDIHTTPAKEAVYVLERLAENLRLQKGFRAEDIPARIYSEYLSGNIKTVKEANEQAIKALDAEIEASTDVARQLEIEEVKSLLLRNRGKKGFIDVGIKNVEKDQAILRNNQEIAEAF